VHERDDLAASEAAGSARIDRLEHRGAHDGGSRLSRQQPGGLELPAALSAEQLGAQGDDPERIALRGEDLVPIHVETPSSPVIV